MSVDAADGATLHRSLGFWISCSMDSPTSRRSRRSPRSASCGTIQWPDRARLRTGGVCMYFTARSYAMMTEVLPSRDRCTGFAVTRWANSRLHGRLDDPARLPVDTGVRVCLVAVALQTLIPASIGLWIVLLPSSRRASTGSASV